MPGVVNSPLTDEMNNTRPWDARIFGSTACVTAICEMTLTSNCLVKSSSANPSTGPLTTMPALLTTPFN